MRVVVGRALHGQAGLNVDGLAVVRATGDALALLAVATLLLLLVGVARLLFGSRLLHLGGAKLTKQLLRQFNFFGGEVFDGNEVVGLFLYGRCCIGIDSWCRLLSGTLWLCGFLLWRGLCLYGWAF